MAKKTLPISIEYRLAVKVIPKAKRSEIVGWEGKELKIRLAAVPEKGAANDELIRFLAEVLKTARSNLRLISGATSRHKQVGISRLTVAQLEMSLGILPEGQ